MEYSLYSLNKSCNLNKLTLTTLTEKLNLIGFEVDEIFLEELSTNSNITNIRLLINIPSNREDLLNENFLKSELSTIFFFENKNIWDKVKPEYGFLLKQKYFQYRNYDNIGIKSVLSNILMYNLEIKFSKEFVTPSWLKTKLKNAGLPITSTINDLLTLINFEWGQTLTGVLLPENKLESFDFSLEQLTQSQEANIGGTETFLEQGTIVLKDKNNQIASALGIINSLSENIQDKKVIFQGCFYDIHQNLLKLNTINTKISLRFLRKTYLETFKIAFQRLVTLVEILTESSVILKKYSNVETALELKPHKILKLEKNVLRKLLNIQKIELEIFQKAKLKILCQTQQELYFQIPNFRTDLTREIDIIEEYSRFVGYKNFQEIPPTKSLSYYQNKKKPIEWSKQFFLNVGFNEITTTSLEELPREKNHSVVLRNPLNNELATLRSSLLGKMLAIFETNLKSTNAAQNYFEVGRVFKNLNGKIVEQEKLGGVFQLETTETQLSRSTHWFKAKGLIEAFLANFDYEIIETVPLYEPSSYSHPTLPEINSYFHPTKSVIFKTGKKILGKFGQLNPLKANLKQPTYVFELNVCYLKSWQMSSRIKFYEECSKYPVVTKDLSFTISKEKEFFKIKDLITRNTEHLKSIEFFDIYFEGTQPTSVNIGLRLEFQSKTQTLVSETIETEMTKIKNSLIQDFCAQFRN
jgi:phenylalanyl-tRNA synthetase beta chain